jgi:hypothetical protein
LIVSALVSLSSCVHQCNEIGCLTGVTVDFPREFPVSALPLTVTICADEVCDTTTIDPISTAGQTSFPVAAQLALDDRSERDVQARVEVRSESSGKVLTAATGTGRLRRSQPNGKGCDPVCYATLLTYDELTNSLTQR